MEQYYIIENETKKGPFDLKELAELYLSENTLVWKKGLKDWTELKNLSEYIKTIPPPIPKSSIPNKPDSKGAKNIEENIISDNIPDIDLKIESPEQGSEMSNHNNAGFGLRLVAFIIDFSILFGLTSFFWKICQLPIPLNYESIFSSSYFIFKNPLGILFGWFFYAAFESSRFQATPGKAILELKVTDENFEKIGFLQASQRFFGKILSGLIIGIGYIMIVFTKNKQGLHDQMADTLVLRENVKEVKRKPTAWIIISVSFLLFLVSLYIPANTKLIKTLDSFNSNNNISSDLNSNIQNLQFSYQGISFEYQDNWKVEKEELQQDLAYQINCEKKGINSSEIISITWLNMEMKPSEMIQNTIEGMTELPTHKYSNVKTIYTTVYKGYDAVKSEFDLILFRNKYFGVIISFNSNGKTILILKQADNINKLDSEFKTVENSLKIE
jgi:uncharacterized RDD family membrane protein YckC